MGQHSLGRLVGRGGAAGLLAALVLALGLWPATAATAKRKVPENRDQIVFSFAPVVKKAAPAVVNVYTRKVVERATSPFLADPFFRRFFGDLSGGKGAQSNIERALGSGVIVGADGIIVTNEHVVKGADQITVALADRREFPAKVVGVDERADLAVLKIDANGSKLPVLQFGDSDAVQVGDLVIAIGNPFGVGQTVTNGIISALARTAVGVNDFDFFIQTDAAINPGNSGGALVTMDGKLIGVNTAIYSRSGGSLGIGFAIPSNMVRLVVAGILSGGKVARPWLGINGQSVTTELAAVLKLERPIGVVVDALYPDGPGAEAGLRSGDVIVKVDGREVDDAEALRYRIATRQVGTSASLTVMRDGQPLTVAIRLKPPPETVPRDTTTIGGEGPFGGATVANLSPALAEEIGANSFEQGVVVISVHDNTPAARLGLQAGDVVLRANGTAIKAVADLKRIVAAQPSSWHLSFRRGGRELNVAIDN